MDSSFEGSLSLLGDKHFQKIKNSHVLVIGIGGVGSWVCETLARSGVKEITIVDLDDLCQTNINRQVIAHSRNVGQFKVDEMKKRLELISPKIKVHALQMYYNQKNHEKVFHTDYDCVIDCIDQPNEKIHLAKFSHRNKVPLVMAGAVGGKRDPYQFIVTDLSKTNCDHLLKKVRISVKQELNLYSRRKMFIRCVYSTEMIPSVPDSGQGALCSSRLGSMSHMTATLGQLCAYEAIKILTDE